MSASRVLVVGIGMTTAVGLSARETAASVRARVARFGQSRFQDRELVPFTLAQVPDEGLAPLPAAGNGAPLGGRAQRLLRLALPALRGCLAPLGDARVPLAMSLALPETETSVPFDRAGFVARLAAATDGAFDPARSDPSHAGRAGGVVAIGQAVQTIAQGLASFVVAGGVDSYRDLYVLGALDRDRRVKSDVNLDGFIPGEGAAFLLLASEGAAAARGLSAIAAISPAAVGFEPGHLYSPEPYRGEGLAATIQGLLASGAAPAPITDVWSSMNGESHWGKEWGVSYLRSRPAFADPFAIHHPADCYGDAGAAAGPILAGLAALDVGKRRSPALVYGSSDRGARAALVVTPS